MTDIWYHGTRRGFTRGGALFPRAAHGGAPTTAPTTEGRAPLADAPEWVYMTPNVDLAWAYAWAAPGRGKPKVLVLSPYGIMEQDLEHSVHMDAWRCEWARVEKVLTEPTMTEAEAREGWTTS